MAFEPGNELQRLGHKQRILTEHLRRAAAEGDGKRIRAGCDKLMNAFNDGEPWALAMVFDRLEGKAAPMNVDTGESVPDVTLIKMVVMQPNPNLINGLGRVEKEILSQEKESLAPLPTPPRSVIAEHGGGDE